MAQGFVEFFKGIENPVTNFLKETSLDHSDVKNTVEEIDLGFFCGLVMKPNGDLFRGSLPAGLFPKRPPKFHIGQLGGHLLSDLFDGGSFAVDFLANIVPVYLLLPTAVLAGPLQCRL